VLDSAVLTGLKVSVNIEHTFIGDLVVTLVPPPAMGVPSVALHRRTGGRTVNLRRTYDAGSDARLAVCLGKKPAGDWKLEVRDEARIDTGLIRGFGLELKLQSSVIRAPKLAASPPRRTPRRRARRRA
jgi:subtilisin-like proprotein convertase family protein